MNETKLLHRVRALLAKAESTDFPEEAETFNRKAAELIAQYGIDEALLAAAGQKQDKVIVTDIMMGNPYSHDKGTLLCTIARSMRCRGILHSRGKEVYKVTIVGYETDIERIELLYTSLLLQATSQVIHARPHWTSNENTTSYRKSWWLGLTAAVSERLRAAEQYAMRQHQRAAGSSSSAPSTELVLRDRTAAVNATVDELFGKLGKTKRRATSGSGYRNGQLAGERADLNQTRVGRQTSAIK